MGPEFTAILWSEGLFRSFSNRRQLAAYAGLAPTPWQSGSVAHEQGVSKAGNPRLRTTMIQLAWVPRRAAEGFEFSVIESQLSCQFERTRDTRTPYVVDITGGGRTSDILRLIARAIATREWNYLRENARSRALKFDKTDALLSSVGPFLSVQEGSFCDCGGKHPAAGLHFRAYDLRESQPGVGTPVELPRNSRRRPSFPHSLETV
jgi:hypothetical protein